MRILLIMLLATMLFGSAPIAGSAQGACPIGRKTEHFPTVDLSDVVRLISADFGLNLQPAISLPHVNVDADLSCYSRGQALAFLQGLGLRIVPVGAARDRVFMVYADGDAQRMAGTIRSYRLRYATADKDTLDQLTKALPDDAYVALRPAINTIIVGGNSYVLTEADQFFQQIDVPAVTQTATIGLNYAVASDIATQLAPRLPPNAITANPSNNSVTVSGSPETIALAKSLVAGLDAPGYQVLLRFSLVDDFPTNDASTTGVAVGGVDSLGNQTPGSGTTIITLPGWNVRGNIAIGLNVTHGLSKVADLGDIRTLNNEKATFNDVQRYPFSEIDPLTGAVTSIDSLIGVVVALTPTVGNDGKHVTIAFDFKNSDLGGFTLQGRPISVEKDSVAKVITTDGKPVVLTDVMEKLNSQTIQKIPGLSSIPLVGEIFKYRQTQHREGSLKLLITPIVEKIQ